MKNLKFLFLSLFMVAFLAPSSVNAQATPQWYDDVGVGITIDGTYWVFTSVKHRVVTANGIINYVAWGVAEDLRGDNPGEILPEG
jgi:hypothetical protein